MGLTWREMSDSFAPPRSRPDHYSDENCILVLRRAVDTQPKLLKGNRL